MPVCWCVCTGVYGCVRVCGCVFPTVVVRSHVSPCEVRVSKRVGISDSLAIFASSASFSSIFFSLSPFSLQLAVSLLLLLLRLHRLHRLHRLLLLLLLLQLLPLVKSTKDSVGCSPGV